jgi:hypothetical protein
MASQRRCQPGDNAQFSGPQVNITGQLALAGAQGGGALSSASSAQAPSGRRRFGCGERSLTAAAGSRSANNLTTGIATAINYWSLTATQANSNAGDATGVVLAAHPFRLGGDQPVQRCTGQQVGNVAIANSGGNIQADGGQARCHRAGRGDGSEAGGSAARLRRRGCRRRRRHGAAGTSRSATTPRLANNYMTTGDATAINQVSVDVHQDNHNDGDATAVGL